MNNCTQEIDAYWMHQALKLARKGQYTTRPNPCVGCVIVKNGKLIGSGWHKVCGDWHAEVNALKEAGVGAAGGTMYVTLEPCAHHGHTPPCCEALTEAGLKRVVVSVQDPNPVVAGKGIVHLQAHGLQVDVGLLAKEAISLNAGFFKRIEQGLPFVTLKQGMTLDGKVADFEGNSQWITSVTSRQDVQELRARHDAILVSASTVLKDNCRLTVRELPEKMSAELKPHFKQPAKVILDSQLKLTGQESVFDDAESIIIYTCSEKKNTGKKFDYSKVTIVQIKQDKNKMLDLESVLHDLACRKINSVFVEGGARLSGAFLKESLVDEWVLYVAPSVLGDAAKSIVSFNSPIFLKDRLGYSFSSVEQLEEDLKIKLSLGCSNENY